ncbi:predicted protein [Naegleria gruberi]|uniref:Predicted protein n=1 Tax=Naegleria gruberi TaxID=5762 RepID=D2VR65_NAEGR|nr:uncharacterized protein NAEGRDRAFT_71476 [Naegleria gruberi]EFC40551.1 predicted protein [Naegleria gruberi]|eukprot:XP_002673295.1 predicted protein [Naegleria gruberi strain NEG-M]
MDKCDCNNGWFGSDCSIHSCNGTSSQDLHSVCNNGNGQCIGTELCLCNQNWAGQFCTIPKCFGVISTDATVCSTHGNCTDINTCQCNTGWFGTDCSIHSCNGTSSQDLKHVCNEEMDSQDEQNVCNGGRGQCIGTDICSCNETWTGQFCEIPKCFGLNSSDNSVCSSHGQCINADTCHCNKGWFGSNCSIHSCNGTSSQDVQNVCNGGNGQCIGTDLCLCNQNWAGQFCTIPKCYGVISTDATVCSTHGNCTDINTCQCNTGWFGPLCSIHSCNGTSSQDLKHVCNGGNGVCIQMDKCDCKSGWTGQFCEIPTCFGLASTAKKVCAGHGDCMSSDKCSCNNGWFGSDCSIHSCNGTSSQDEQNVCNGGRGQCIGTDICSCNETWTGQFCEIPKCFGLNSSDNSVCSSHGQCINANTCHCNKGWFGSNCSIHSCNGTSSQDVQNVCNGGNDSSSISSFGSNVVCRYSNKTSNDFIIELGTDNSIQVDQEILLNRNVFNRNKLGNDYQSFKIGNAENPIPPTILISQKTTYSSCENILLDASESYSTDGKQISYKWEIVSSNMMTLPNNNSSKLSITYDSINAGSHTFKLTTTSQILKTSSSKQVTFQKLNYATPVISIEGSDSLSLSTSSLPLIVRKLITLPSCLPSKSEIIVKWEYLSGTGMEYQVDSYNNLKIVKFNDLTQLTHQVKVSSYLKGKEDQISSVNLNIQMTARPLVVNLIQIESTIDQVIIEIEEIDSDLQTIPFDREWSTNNLNNNDNILQYLSSIKNNTLTITKSLVNGASQFDISLRSSKVSRYSTSTLSILFPESPTQIPPSITPANSPPSKLNKGTLLSVQSIVSSASNNIIREWTMNGQSIPSDLTSNMRMQLSESDELILDTSSLTEGSTYQISFKVTNVDSLLSASLNHSFVINKSPKPCDCQVSPLSGIAMTTIFTFNCPKCQNDQNSNTFEYGFIDDFSKSNFPLSKTEELYQKLPMPNSGNKLDLYVKVIDSLTGSSSITTKQVTISLPVVKSLAEIKALTSSWNQIATLAPVGDYQRSVFNTATISRTMNLLFNSISSKRDFCNGNGQFKDGKCVCNFGFTTRNCKWSTEDFEFIQSLIRDLLNDFMGSSQIMTTASESTNRNYITNLLFGLNSISQNSEYLSNQMVNSSLILLRDALVSVQSSTAFVLSRGDLVNLQNILNLQENLMDGEKLLQTVELLGQVLLRNVLIGQTPFKFETNSYLTVLNKHFKNQMNGMKFESEMVNITLPWNISSFLKTNSIKSPIKYRWNIQKNTDTIAIANQPGKIISINSVANSLQLDPSPQSYSKYLFDIEMKQYDSQAAYVCANIGSASLETDCSISIKNNQIATCECSSLGYNLVILEYKSIENHVSTSSSSNSNIIVKKPPTSNPLMWLLLLLVLIPLTALLIAVIVWFVVKKLGKDKNNTRNPYMQTQESSSTIELKHV